MAANMDIVMAEWRGRMLAEYRSASMASEFLSWLLRLGYSSDTLQIAHKFVGNELDHADMSFEVYTALGGSEEVPDVREGALVIPHGFGRPCPERLTLACLDIYCIGETVAASLFAGMRDGATESGPRQLLDRIVSDSSNQCALGWAVLNESIERDAKQVTALAKKHLPQFLARVERAWGLLPDDWTEPVGPAELCFGLIPRARYKREFYQAVAESLLPQLDDCNLPGRPSWGKRPRDRS